MKPLIALDLDDLIYPFVDYFINYVNNSTNYSISREEILTFRFEDALGCEPEDAVALCRSMLASLEAHPQPLPGSVEAIARLAKNFRLMIVTARGDSMREITLDFLREHFDGHFEEVHLCNGYVKDLSVRRKKVDVCIESGAIALVDDSLANVRDVAEAGLIGILYGEFPWNKADVLPEGVRRVVTWEGVVEILEDANEK